MSSRFDGARLEQAREQRALTRAQLAQELGVDVDTVRQWEVGIAEPAPRSLPRVAAAVQVGVDELYLRAQAPLLLKDLRRRAGLTQAELAQQVPTSKSMVSNWERGKRRISVEDGERLATVLGITYPEVVSAFRATDDHFNHIVDDLDGPVPSRPFLRSKKLEPASFVVDRQRSVHTISEYEGPFHGSQFDLTCPQVSWFRFRCKNIPTTKEVVAINEQLGADYFARYNHMQRRIIGQTPEDPVHLVRWQNNSHDGLQRHQMAARLSATTLGWRNGTITPIADEKYMRGQTLMIIVDWNDPLIWVQRQLAEENFVSLWFLNGPEQTIAHTVSIFRPDGELLMPEFFERDYRDCGLTGDSTCEELLNVVVKQKFDRMVESSREIARDFGTGGSLEEVDREFSEACAVG